FDIAGKGLADHTSFKEAVFLAIDVFHARQQHAEISRNPLKVKEKHG
ncbi:MAG TPA: 4-hydroxythreonine-4-phosphate dehydrogenase PdxA, partial [Flavobacterium sp.]|nr:4-hydroxythreonine-4-phosphate dehydrogenase PdxA [Flavobacterium sp.]